MCVQAPSSSLGEREGEGKGKNFQKSELLEETLISINSFRANQKDSDGYFAIFSHIGPDTYMLK